MLHNLENFKIFKDKTLGYEVIYYPNHPNARSGSGVVYLHRIIMENYLNRYLDKNEIVHHKDENRSNNNIENLELTTNSEHCKHHHPRILPLIKICEICGEEFKPDKEYSKFCSSECYSIYRAKNIPSKEELEILIWQKPTTQLAKDFNVSDVAISKWCKKYNISKPPRGYWMKQK